MAAWASVNRVIASVCAEALLTAGVRDVDVAASEYMRTGGGGDGGGGGGVWLPASLALGRVAWGLFIHAAPCLVIY